MPPAERVQKRRGVVLWGEVRGWLLTWSPPHSITCRQLVTEQITLRLRLFQKWDCLPGSESEQKERICPCLLLWRDTQPQDGRLELGLHGLKGEKKRVFQALGHGALEAGETRSLRGRGKCLDGKVYLDMKQKKKSMKNFKQNILIQEVSYSLL